MSKVIVIDYGVGNLHSVVKALRHEGGDVSVTSEGESIRSADRLVLPGVGAFGDGMRQLRERKLVEPILDFVKTGRPFLGICLGMQLLLAESEEFGQHTGLGIIPGKVVAIPARPGLKIPHIGWNALEASAAASSGQGDQGGQSWKGTLLEDVPASSPMYFVHSFAAVPAAEARLADATYGGFLVSAAIRRDNVTGLQFHPEKSGPTGLRIVNRFLR